MEREEQRFASRKRGKNVMKSCVNLRASRQEKEPSKPLEPLGPSFKPQVRKDPQTKAKRK